jgi:hypothetical protein
LLIFIPLKGEIMAKQQSFADKAKSKKKQEGISVKMIKTVKTAKGTFKFNEKLVKLDDISKVSELK